MSCQRLLFGWIFPRASQLCLAFVLGCLLFSPRGAAAQDAYTIEDLEEVQNIPGILRNVVSTLAAQENTLWAGPYLQRTTDGGETWKTASVPELERSRGNRLSSLRVSGDTLFAGLATTAAEASAAAGFLVSSNKGETLHFRPSHLDAGTEDTLRYGDNLLPALPVTDSRQSPPYGVDVGPGQDELWVAGGRSGLRFSKDFGETWHRIVLPPDQLDRITPEEQYDFSVRPPDNGEGHANHEAYSVLVDASGTVWAGTSAGVNRSSPEDVFPQFAGDRAWDRIGVSGEEDGLNADMVVALAEQQVAGSSNSIWIAAWPSGIGQQLGVSRTSDGGETFEHLLRGERAHDFAFRGNTAFIATNRGLFHLDAAGEIEQHFATFNTPHQPHYDAPAQLAILTVEVTDDALWAGTREGLFRSTDGGETWRVFRAEVPTRPDEPSEDIPEVDTYAYPTPFSPSGGMLRFVVEVDAPQDVRIQIFDFAMNHVRDLSGSCSSPGRCEISWEGTDRGGRRLANGTYFYTLSADQQTYRGKIVVLE